MREDALPGHWHGEGFSPEPSLGSWPAQRPTGSGSLRHLCQLGHHLDLSTTRYFTKYFRHRGICFHECSFSQTVSHDSAPQASSPPLTLERELLHARAWSCSKLTPRCSCRCGCALSAWCISTVQTPCTTGCILIWCLDHHSCPPLSWSSGHASALQRASHFSLS